MNWIQSCVGCLRNKILMIVAMACAICLLIAVGVARYFNELDVHKGIVSKSQAIHSRLDAATKFVAQQGGMKPTIERFIAKYGNPQQMSDDDKHEVLKQVPIFAAMRIGREGAEKEHYRFRVFSDEPRKKDNLATPEELAIFKRFEKDPALEEIVSDTGKVVTVFRPVRLSQAQGCLTCHGDPATSPWKNGHDILGFRMENWQDGKLHGVFALSTNVDEIKAVQAGAEWMSTDKQIGFYIGIGALLALFCAALLIRKPLERVKAVSDKLVSDSAEVGAAVGQIFAVSQDLSSASSQQAASVQETAASIEEISAMVKKSAESASESEHASTSSKTSAEKGREIVTQMVASMQEINRSNDQVAKAVASGNEKISQIVSLIEEIGTKTKVINDIVFQTKLLSFNASVEAARAGEHGKGFAVVAEEVGKLAQMSGNAAKEITGLLEESVGRVKGIVEETRQTVEQLMHEARTTVEKGSKVAQDCESMLTEIVESSNNVSQMVAGIATASQEQANGVFEISKAIRQIDQTTQIGSASAESCSSAAEQLSVKVKGLRGASAELRLVIDGKNTVNRFRWGSEYALGVTAMDDEHKVLIEKMNRLADIFEESRNPSREMLLEAFGDLASYTQKHFSDEEAFMESVNYPELGAHQGIHKALLAQVGEFGKRIEAGTCHGPDLMDFLNDWLMRHILNVDMKYSRYVKREGRGGDRGREKRAA